MNGMPNANGHAPGCNCEECFAPVHRHATRELGYANTNLFESGKAVTQESGEASKVGPEASSKADPPPTPKRKPKAAKPKQQGTGLDLEDAEPADEPVDGQALFGELVEVLRRYVVLPAGGPTAVALWVALTYLSDVVETLPRLLISSPTWGCGKSRLLAVVGALVRRPLPAVSVSPASLFRTIEESSPTLLLDEMDNADLQENGELRAILNSGHSRSNAWTIRVTGERHEPARFSTWAPVAYAAIKDLPGPIASRSIRIRMARRVKGERVDRLREARIADQLLPLRQRLARWCQDNRDAIGEGTPDLPELQVDRDQDNWSPLVAIADAIGGLWPRDARGAALTLSGQAVPDESIGEQLLADLRTVFDETGAERLSTEAILRALHAMEERPWREWGRPPREITARGLADLLGHFQIASRTVRLPDDVRLKGFHREQFEDAWTRYLPSPRLSIRDGVTDRENTGPNPELLSVTKPPCHGYGNEVSTSKDAPCHAVTDAEPQNIAHEEQAIIDALERGGV